MDRSDKVETSKAADKIKKNDFFSVKGCFVHILGILSFLICVALGYAIGDTPGGSFGIIIGIVVMLVLFRVGSKFAAKWYCGSCNSQLKDKRVTTCPACKSSFV